MNLERKSKFRRKFRRKLWLRAVHGREGGGLSHTEKWTDGEAFGSSATGSEGCSESAGEAGSAPGSLARSLSGGQ